jgi:spermidine/putrescine transport system substrate-binding protein
MKPKEGILTYCCGLVLTHDAPQPDLAYDLMDALLDPKAGEWLVNYGYGHSNRKTFDLVSEELLARRGFPKDPAQHLKSGVFSKENARLDDLQRMFEEVKAS